MSDGKTPNRAHAKLLLQTGIKYREQGKYEEACKSFEQAAKADSEYGPAYNSWGHALSRMGFIEEASEKYKKVTEISPESSYGYYNLAVMMWQHGRYEEARKVWDNALDVFFRQSEKSKETLDVEDFYYFGGLLHFVFNDLSEAEKIYQEGLELNSNHPDILIRLADLYLERCDEESIVGDGYIRVSAWKPFSRKEEYQGIEEGDRTARDYGRARELHKKAEGVLIEQVKMEDSFPIYVRLAGLYLKMEEYEKGEKFFQGAIEKNGEEARAYDGLGVVYKRTERTRKAVRCFEAAVRRSPRNLTMKSNLAEAYLQTGQLERAEVEYKKVLRITNRHVQSQIGMGEVYTAMGDDGEGEMYGAALEHYTKALKLANSPASSRRLRRKELAALYYSRGYAAVKHYEADNATKDRKLLQNALKDFKECERKDPDHHKAKRAVTRLKERLRFFFGDHMRDVVAPLAIFVLSALAFLVIQSSFYFKFPAKIEVELYVPMTFGMLIFMVAGIYLPQILRLKVGSIELEKSSIDQVRPSGTLEIRK